MYRHGFWHASLLLVGLLHASTGCSSGPGDGDGGEMRDVRVSVDDGARPDGFVPDATRMDAGRDGSADASLDGGQVCTLERFPLPAEPVCTLEEATCYRECPDRACTSSCGVIFLSDCGQCIATVIENCMMDHCSEENTSWQCCVRALCPSGGACPECDEERTTMRACLDGIYDGYCRPELEVCFP